MRQRLACVVLALLGIVAAPASATAHPFLGELLPRPYPFGPGALKDACGVAVSPGGTIFLSNHYDRKIFVYSNERAFLGQLPVPTPEASPEVKEFGPCDLAVDSTGSLYVNNWHSNVLRYPSLGLGFGAPEVIDDGEATGIAIDPATDNLLVNRRTEVLEYAAPVSSASAPARTIGGGTIENGYGVAVSAFPGDADFASTAGRVYVADAADGAIEVFDPLGNPVQVIDGEGTPQAGFNHLADTDLAVDPADGHLYVVDNLEPGFEQPEAVVDEFSPAGRYRGPIPPEVASGQKSRIVDAVPTSLAIHEGDFYVTSGNYFNDETLVNGNPHLNGRLFFYGPAVKSPTAILTASKSGAGSGTVFSSDPFGLRCGSACEGEFAAGRFVTLVATPDPHNRLVGWTGCDSQPSPGRCRVTMSAARAVNAEFAPIPQQPLALAVLGAGTVASAPAGILCGAGSCAADFDQGSVVTLAATPAAGSTFAGWSGCDSEPAPGSCAVTMSAARSVTARFDSIPPPPVPPPPPPPRRTLSVLSTALGAASGVVVSDPGGIDCGGSCAAVYGDGTTVTLTARPAPHSAFVGWGGCDRSDGASCTVTLGDDKTVVAAFGPGDPGPLRVRGLSVRGKAALLRVAVPAGGELTATSPRTVPASALPIDPAVVELRLELNAAGARALARAKRHRLSVPVALSLAPFEGGTTVKTRRTVVFATSGKGRR